MVTDGKTWWCWSDLDSAEIYDPRTRHWSAIDPMPNGFRSRFPRAVALPNGNIAVVGDYGKGVLYQVHSGKWGQLPNARLDYSEPSLIAARDGTLLLIGGEKMVSDVPYPVASVQALGLGDLAWRSVSPLRLPRTDPSVVKLMDGRIMVSGGWIGAYGPNFTTGSEIFGKASSP